MVPSSAPSPYDLALSQGRVLSGSLSFANPNGASSTGHSCPAPAAWPLLAIAEVASTHAPCSGRLDLMPILYIYFSMPLLAMFPTPQSLLFFYPFSKSYHPESFSLSLIMKPSQSSQTDVISFPDLHNSSCSPLPFQTLLYSFLHISVTFVINWKDDMPLSSSLLVQFLVHMIGVPNMALRRRLEFLLQGFF